MSKHGGSELTAIAERSRAQITAENFPVALRLLPKAPRDALSRVYSFARFVDDVGDEADGDRLALLDEIEADVRALWGGAAQLAPVAALAPFADIVGIEPLLRLIDANRIDQKVSRYESFDDLIGYCMYSAAPVGRIVLALAGATKPIAVTQSDAVCNALQVLEHCQDVAEDYRAGRIYLPASELRSAGVHDTDLLGSTATPGLRHVIAIQVGRAEALLAEGRPLVRSLHGWARLAVSGYVAGGLATASALRKADFDTLSQAVKADKRATVTRALALVARR